MQGLALPDDGADIDMAVEQDISFDSDGQVRHGVPFRYIFFDYEPSTKASSSLQPIYEDMDVDMGLEQADSLDNNVVGLYISYNV